MNRPGCKCMAGHIWYTQLHGNQCRLGPLPNLPRGRARRKPVRRGQTNRTGPTDRGPAHQGSRKCRRNESVRAFASRADSDRRRGRTHPVCGGDGRRGCGHDAGVFQLLSQRKALVQQSPRGGFLAVLPQGEGSHGEQYLRSRSGRPSSTTRRSPPSSAGARRSRPTPTGPAPAL